MRRSGSVESAALRDERRGGRSEPKRRADRDHRRAAGVDGVDDLGVVDPLEVDRGDAEVAVPKLPLNDEKRHRASADSALSLIVQRSSGPWVREADASASDSRKTSEVLGADTERHAGASLRT